MGRAPLGGVRLGAGTEGGSRRGQTDGEDGGRSGEEGKEEGEEVGGGGRVKTFWDEYSETVGDEVFYRALK
jgi:hypothetical protein